MPRISESFTGPDLKQILKAVVFISVLTLALVNAFFYAQIALLDREVSELQADYRALSATLNETRANNEFLTETYFNLWQATGQFPKKLEEPLFEDNTTRIFGMFNSLCPPCITERNEEYVERLSVWTVNLSSDDFREVLLNTHQEKDGEGFARTIFSAFGIDGSEVDVYLQDSIVTLNNVEGFVFSWSDPDAAIRAAVVHLTLGGNFSQGSEFSDNDSTAQTTGQEQDLFLPVIYLLTGIAQGFNPCLLALVSFVVAITLQQKHGFARAVKRVVIITLSVFYIYLLIGFLLVSSAYITSYLSLFTLPLALVLIVIGGLNFLEVGHDVYTGKWKRGEDARFPLFKTPKRVKTLIQKTASEGNLYVDFAVGALFSLIKLPCIGPLFLTLVVTIPHQPAVALTNIVALTLGAVLPIFIIGSLACVGFLKASQLSTLRFKGRIVQRLIIGSSLVVSAIVLVYALNF